jgi:hypothetical protein
MANSDDPSQVPPQPPSPPDPDHKALVTAMIEVFNSLRREAPSPDQVATAAAAKEATDAAAQYSRIKGSLRTHSEKRPGST